MENDIISVDFFIKALIDLILQCPLVLIKSGQYEIMDL